MKCGRYIFHTHFQSKSEICNIYRIESVNNCKIISLRYLCGLLCICFFTGELWMCPQCLKIFKKQRYLRKHLRDICGMAAMFNCPYSSCSYSCKKKANLRLHIMNKHTQMKMVVKCTETVE